MHVKGAPNESANERLARHAFAYLQKNCLTLKLLFTQTLSLSPRVFLLSSPFVLFLLLLSSSVLEQLLCILLSVGVTIKRGNSCVFLLPFERAHVKRQPALHAAVAHKTFDGCECVFLSSRALCSPKTIISVSSDFFIVL